MKTTLSSLIVLVLSSSAVAAPASTPPPPPRPLHVRLTVKVASSTRVHELAVFDDQCNRVVEKTVSYEDEIRLCTHPAPRGVMVEVEWRTRNGADEYRTSSETLMARTGSQFEVGRSGGTRFGLQLL